MHRSLPGGEPKSAPHPGPATIVALALLLGNGSVAPAQSDAAQPEPSQESTESGAAASASARMADPYEAFAAGRYHLALQVFVDQQVERPEDPEVALNLGSVHYKMNNFTEADRAYATTALAADPSLRQAALYNLGNSAYRQGRLDGAVELYKAALDVDPDDEDAKFNLEFVRNEIRRRHEEAKKRQQQEQQNQQSQEGQEGGEQQDQEQQPRGEPQEPAAGADQDQDGLPDSVERTGDNPTDPYNPDTDGDGLPDGAEDLNRNGRVDPGETDPNRTDGDGVPDAQEAPPNLQAAGGPVAEGGERLTLEEAERYLQALQEGRPQRRHPPQARRRARPAKDW